MLLTEDIIEKVSKASLFCDVKSEALKVALTEETVSLQSYKSGEIIYSAENYKSAVGIILQGSAKVKTKEGTVIVGCLEENDIFGCQSLFLGSGYFTNEIVASANTKVLYLEKKAIIALMQLDNGFSLDYIRYLSERIYFLNKRIVNFTGGTAESRLANYLLSCFGDYKVYVTDRPMNQLAVSLDIGRASLYRALDRLIESGAIEREGKILRLINREKLISFIN